MDDIPLSLLLTTLILLLVLSAFFSMSETSMMAVNRYRLRHRALHGHRGAKLAQALLARTDKLLGVILLGNNFVNAAAASLATVITFRLVGQNEIALGIATVLVTFAILVFAEATPKVIAATHPERIALAASYPLTLLLKLAYPVVWFVNLFVHGLIRLLRVQPEPETTQLTPEELRVLVLESGQFIAKKHQSMLLNLFELQNCTVDDVMIPRQQIEMIDLADDIDDIVRQLRTCHHTRLPVCEGSSDNVIGVLHTRKVLGLTDMALTPLRLRSVLRSPYYVPAGTPLFTQLQNFQENRRRIGIVVDEYGEMQGLLTLEDILEQVVGEFTTSAPTFATHLDRQADGSVLVDGSEQLRDLNRKFDTRLPVDGPRTVNGLVLEYFQDIPEPGTCFKLHGCVFEVVQAGDKGVRRVRIRPPG